MSGPGPRCVAAAAAAMLYAFPEAAIAQMYRDGAPPQHRLVYRDLNVFRLNPLGLISDARVSYRYRLYESESLALRDNFVSVGLAPVVSGGFARVGPIVEIQPLTVLQLWALYEWVGYYGAANFLQSFESATDAHGDGEIQRRGALSDGDPLKNYSAGGTQLMVGANLQLKVKDVAVRSQFRAARPDFELRAGDRVFYDVVYDLLVGNKGWFYNNDFDVLYQMPGGLTAGVRWTAARAFYDDAHFAPDDDRAKAPGAIHRAGPILAYTWKKPDGAKFEPTFLVVVNWWLSSPNRTGQDVSQAMPYLVVGYAFNGDLLAPAR